MISHGDFALILDIPEGEHQYKFQVDGQWIHSPNQVKLLFYIFYFISFNALKKPFLNEFQAKKAKN